jgi:hypothetical protein
MHFVDIALLLGCLATSAQSRSIDNGCSAPSQQNVQGKAAYFISNNNSNAVIAVAIGRDGKLSGGTSTPTGGNGAVSIDGSTNAPAQKDGLVSQSSLSIAGNASLHQHGLLHHLGMANSSAEALHRQCRLQHHLNVYHR